MGTRSSSTNAYVMEDTVTVSAVDKDWFGQHRTDNTWSIMIKIAWAMMHVAQTHGYAHSILPTDEYFSRQKKDQYLDSYKKMIGKLLEHCGNGQKITDAEIEMKLLRLLWEFYNLEHPSSTRTVQENKWLLHAWWSTALSLRHVKKDCYKKGWGNILDEIQKSKKPEKELVEFVKSLTGKKDEDTLKLLILMAHPERHENLLNSKIILSDSLPTVNDLCKYVKISDDDDDSAEMKVSFDPKCKDNMHYWGWNNDFYCRDGDVPLSYDGTIVYDADGNIDLSKHDTKNTANYQRKCVTDPEPQHTAPDVTMVSQITYSCSAQ